MYNHKIAKTCIGNAIRKYGIDSFFIVVLEVCENKEQLCRCEVKWIARLKCKKPDGYNLTDGGENPPSMKGRKFSKKTRDRMAASHRGKKRPPEVCAKISVAKKGKPRSEETKAKLSASRKGISPSNKGKPAPAEARARMSAAKKGKPSKLKGRKASPEAKARMSAAKKGKPAHNKGIPCPPEVKAKISETLKNRHKAAAFLADLGGKNNIVDVTNCATRLRVTVKDDSKIADVGTFTEHGAHGLVHNGTAIQVIVGLSVPQVRERFEDLLNAPDEKFAEVEEEIAEAVIVKAVVSGRVIDISEVPDEMFAKKMMGDGVGIFPEGETIVAPADAKVTMIAEESFHAVGLHLKNGADILIHIGIDTVNLKGKGFRVFTKADAQVKEGEPLIRFNRNIIKENGYKDVVIVAVTNSGDFPQMKKQFGDAEGGKTPVINF